MLQKQLQKSIKESNVPPLYPKLKDNYQTVKVLFRKGIQTDYKVNHTAFSSQAYQKNIAKIFRCPELPTSFNLLLAIMKIKTSNKTACFNNVVHPIYYQEGSFVVLQTYSFYYGKYMSEILNQANSDKPITPVKAIYYIILILEAYIRIRESGFSHFNFTLDDIIVNDKNVLIDFPQYLIKEAINTAKFGEQTGITLSSGQYIGKLFYEIVYQSQLEEDQIKNVDQIKYDSKFDQFNINKAIQSLFKIIEQDKDDQQSLIQIQEVSNMLKKQQNLQLDKSIPSEALCFFNALIGNFEVFTNQFDYYKNCKRFYAGWNVIQICAQHGHTDLFQYLYEYARFNVSNYNIKNNTCLHIASKYNNLDIVKYLTKTLFVDPNQAISYKQTPLHYAAMRGSLEVAKFLIQELKVDKFQKQQLGYDALHYASSSGSGNLKFIKYLVEEEGFNILERASSNDTPISLSAQKGCLEIVKYLVEKAKSSLKENEDEKYLKFEEDCLHALGCSVQFPKTLPIIKYFIEECQLNPNKKLRFQKYRTPLILCTYTSEIENLKYLIEVPDIEVETVDLSQFDALTWASINGNLKAVKLLCEKFQLDPFKRNPDTNLSPFIKSATKGNLEVLKFFIEDSSIKHKPDQYSFDKALYGAVCDKRLDVIKYLDRVCKAKPSFCEPSFNMNCLMTASDTKERVIVRYLLNSYKDINLNKRHVDGSTSVFFMAKRDMFEIIRDLVLSRRKIKFNLPGEQRKTIMMFLAMKNQIKLMRLIFERRLASLLPIDAQGKSVLNYCKKAKARDYIESCM